MSMRASRKWYIAVEGLRGFHLSYCRPSRTNYMTFYSPNQIKYLQHFYSILVDVRVLSLQYLAHGPTLQKQSGFSTMASHSLS